MNRFFTGIVIGAIAGAVMGVTLDPMSNRDKKAVKRRMTRMIKSMR